MQLMTTFYFKCVLCLEVNALSSEWRIYASFGLNGLNDLLAYNYSRCLAYNYHWSEWPKTFWGDVHKRALQCRNNECNGVSNHQPNDCLLKRLFRRRSKKTSKLLVTGICEGNSPVTGEFPTQRASNVENVSTWWRHHVITMGQA